MKKLIIATGNKNKLREFQSILKNYDVESIPVEVDEIQGIAEEVIIHKAKETYKILKRPCIIEDSSFGFVEWNGLPGPYIKDFIKQLGYEKLAYLTKDKRAKTTCLIAFAKSEKDIRLFKGEIKGKVAKSKGDNGFDYDKVFIPDGYTKRFSEMSLDEKNKISHRRKAINKLKKYLEKLT